MTGDRDANEMLEMIHKQIKFDGALFTPNISSLSKRTKGKCFLIFYQFS